MISKWDRIVFKAWLERHNSHLRHWHPVKAALIRARFCKNIERVERYLTAEGMIERYKHSTYTPYRRASDHAMSYPSYAWKYKFWMDVCDIIKQLTKQESQQ
jgi:hypothetical protein